MSPLKPDELVLSPTIDAHSTPFFAQYLHKANSERVEQYDFHIFVESVQHYLDNSDGVCNCILPYRTN